MKVTSTDELSAALSARTKAGFYIGGAWIPSNDGARQKLVSPVTEEAWIDVPLARIADVDAAIDAARQAFDSGHGRAWRQVSAPPLCAALPAQ